MKKTYSNNGFKPLKKILRQVNLIIFVIIVGCGLVAYVLNLNNIFQKATSGSEDTNTSTAGIQLDANAVTRLNSLKTSDKNNGNQSIPSGRTNPFAE